VYNNSQAKNKEKQEKALIKSFFGSDLRNNRQSIYFHACKKIKNPAEIGIKTQFYLHNYQKPANNSFQLQIKFLYFHPNQPL
jgi:hypothetical protein